MPSSTRDCRTTALPASVDTTRHGPVYVLRVAGSPELTADAVRELRAPLDEAVEAAADVVLDLGSVEFIDSTGLGLIIALNRRVRRQGGDLRLASPGRDVWTALELTRMHRLVEIYDDVEAAVASFAPDPEEAST